MGGSVRRIVAKAGERYGDWTVWDDAIQMSSHMIAICRCSCGYFNRVQSTRLFSGSTTKCHSCAISTHGQTKSRTWITWSAMHGRCTNPKSPLYPVYGGRGITVCHEWNTFEQFFADMGERPVGMSIDRIDVNGGYENGNCRWANAKTQAMNRRSTVWIEYEGKTYTAIDLARHLGFKYDVILRRFKKGTKLDAPVQKRTPRKNID